MAGEKQEGHPVLFEDIPEKNELLSTDLGNTLQNPMETSTRTATFRGPFAPSFSDFFS